MSGIAARRVAARSEGKESYSARRQELIDVAADVFREKGYEAATLNDVAERFGAERASLYYYVASKQELFQEAVRDVLETNLRAAERLARRRGDAENKLAELIEQIVVSYEENYPYTYLYIQEDMQRVGSADDPWARDMARQSRRIEAITVKLIRQGAQEGSFRADLQPELAAKALWGMLNWTHRWYKPDGEVTSADMAATFSALLLDGLRVRP